MSSDRSPREVDSSCATLTHRPVCVTSLPRTGTVSICAMLQTLGYKTYHAPLHLSKMLEVYAPKVAYADTPAFVPHIASQLKVNENIPVQYVYVDRDFDSWFDSMTKSTNLLRTYHRFSQTPDEQLNTGELADKQHYHAVFGNFDINSSGFKDHIKLKFFEHREEVSGWGLVYKFSEGWEPLCDFLDLNIPNKPIPHEHKKSIGSKK